jgi:hypothetical protein
VTKSPGTKTFSLEEAVRLLPAVRERTKRAMEEIHELRIPSDAGIGDEDGDGEGAEENAAFQEGATRILSEWARDIESMGLEVKGPWLVDFDSGGGYYCWNWPEESLEYFHGYSEGFAGRVRLQ